MLKRIKRIDSHVGHARFLAKCSEDAVGFIPRQADIPSPYRSSPEWNVFKYETMEGQPFVVIVETAHKQFDVFEVPAAMVIPSAHSIHQQETNGDDNE